MSSLVRRTLRTTAAAAGIAALGAGLAGTAVAAPADDAEAPAPETTSGSASAPQGLSSLVPLAGLPGAAAVPDLADLPLPFAFQSPAVRTAAPSGVPGLGAEQILGAAALPQEVPLPDPGSATSRTEIEADPSTLTQVGALPALDSARLFDGLQQVAPTDRQESDSGATEAG